MKVLKKIKKLPTDKSNFKCPESLGQVSDKIQKKPGLLYCRMFFPEVLILSKCKFTINPIQSIFSFIYYAFS